MSPLIAILAKIFTKSQIVFWRFIDAEAEVKAERAQPRKNKE